MSSYHDELAALAKSIGSDGCTHALEVDVDCCWEHDYGYVTGMTPRGVAVTKAEVDQRFRDCIQSRSSLRWLSPWSWCRWLAVSRFGRGLWSKPKRVPVTWQTLLLGNEAVLDEAAEARERIRKERE